MPNYRRWFQPGGTFFFTVCTNKRHPLFRSPDACRMLGSIMGEVSAEMPFQTIAIVVLEDHLHCIWSLPSGNADFSQRWKLIKGRFTRAWLTSGGAERPVTASQRQRGHRGVWQRRFWEHLVRDERDLERRCDYIHYNPVKHGLAPMPWDWQWSSFRRFVRAGHYHRDWGRTEPEHLAGLDYE